MLKRMSIKKIVVATSSGILLLLLYLMPNTTRDINIPNTKIEYKISETYLPVYLIDNYNYVARTNVPVCNCKEKELAEDLIGVLTINGKKNNIIPNGFRSILPANTKVLNLDLNNKVLTIDFSKELLNIEKENEEKMIEGIVYTLTSIEGINKVIIKVEGEVLTTLPNSKKILPQVLDKSYGINKKYDLVSTEDLISYTVFYVNEYENNKYYVPVTKYTNSSDDKIKVIIKELSSSPIYETSLMSYINTGVVLNDYELEGNNLKLNFNKLLLDDIEDKNILEEVVYTISLSMNNIYSELKEVSFYVDNEEISKININDLK